ncbi:MAG: apolipoprotein N-acyltransferase [Pirellulaceae bacterium]
MPRTDAARNTDTASTPTPSKRWNSSEAAWALFSAITLYAAFPPLNVWPLAFVAPIGWLKLIRHREWSTTKPYRLLYVVGFLHWLVLIQWVRLPHWSTYFGWVLLSAYLAAYLPLFVGSARCLVHRWQMPIILAAPICWAGLELLRSRLFSGFALALLGHTQIHFLSLAQVASVCGAYGVGFVLMFTAAGLEAVCRSQRQTQDWRQFSVAAVLLAAVILLGMQGQQRLSEQAAKQTDESVQIALVQGVFDTQFDGDLDRPKQAFQDYLRLSQTAVDQNPNVDLVIWPESMFTGIDPILTVTQPAAQPRDWDVTPDEFQQLIQILPARSQQKVKFVQSVIDRPLLVGTAWNHLGPEGEDRYNSAVHIDSQGHIAQRYDKMHPVMFGEYIPFGSYLPWLYHLTPMPGGLTRGQTPVTVDVQHVKLAPNICFENTVPHLIRGQFNQLRQQDETPDVLVTLTNDGWFWGSSLLDIHLACGVFRAIELGRPMLIAANTGFSAWIAADGTIVQQGPRRQEGILIAECKSTAGTTTYAALGDLPAFLCLVITLGSLASGTIRSRAQKAA